MEAKFTMEKSDILYSQIGESDIPEYFAKLEWELYPGTELEWFDNQIKSNLTGWAKAGLVAAQVKIRSLWKNSPHGYKSFADYCKRSLGKTSWYIDRLIAGAEVMLQLSRDGHNVLPSCESQVRHLVKASNQAGADISAIWDKVRQNNEPEKITADIVAAAVEGRDMDEAKLQPRKISKQNQNLLADIAIAQGKTADQLMSELIARHQEDMTCDSRPDPIAPGVELTEDEIAQELELGEIVTKCEEQWSNKPAIAKSVPVVVEIIGRTGKALRNVGKSLSRQWVKDGDKWKVILA